MTLTDQICGMVLDVIARKGGPAKAIMVRPEIWPKLRFEPAVSPVIHVARLRGDEPVAEGMLAGLPIYLSGTIKGHVEIAA